MANQIKYQVGFDVQKQGLDDLKSSLQQLQKMKLSDIMKINNTDIASARQTFKQISDDAKMVENALEKAFNPKLNTINVERFKESLKGMDLTGLYSSFSKAGAAGESAFRNLTTQVLGTNTTLKQSHALLDKMATTLGNTIKWHAASAAINGVSRSVQQAWGYVKHLDGSLNDIRIVTGKSAEQMGRFAQQANEAAKSLGKTTTDYTDAALIFAQQGLSDKEIEERAKITLKTANVTGQSTNDVSEELTAVWNGYKVNAEQAQLYVDRLAAVAATTASNLEELSTGMSKVAAAANAMGVSEDQLAAQLSTIISVTKQAPESVGTALRTVYARISDIKAGIDQDGVTLGKYSGEMAELGFNVLDVNGKLRDMGQVMEQIGNDWGNLTREQQVHLAQTMAGQRQYSNLIALFDNFQQYNKALNTAQNAAGTLQQQQDIYMESTAAHLNQLKAATQNVYDSLINTDSVNELVDIFTKLTEGVANFVDSIGGGGQLLKSLGSIALTVFNQQISQSLLTTINNFKNASAEADILKQKIVANQELMKSGVGNDTTKYVIGEQKDLLQMNGRLPTDQMQELQNSLNDFAQASGAFEIAQEKLNHLKIAFQLTGISIKDIEKDYGSFDNFLTSGDGFEIAIEALAKLRDGYDPVLEKQAQLKESIQNMNKNSSIQNIKQSIESMANVFMELGTQSGQGIFDSLSKGAQESVQTIIQEMDKINNPDLSAQQKVDLIGQQYANLRWVITNEINSINQTLQAAKNQDKSLTQEQIKNLERRKKALEDFYNIKKGKAEQQTQAQQFVAVAGGIAQMSRALQQFQNLGSIWKNADLSTGQKILQTITNLSFSLPMLINGFRKVSTSLGLLSIMTKKQAIENGVFTASQGAKAFAIRLTGMQAEKTGIKIMLMNKAFIVSPIVAFIAVLAAAVTALGAYKKSLEEANKAAIEEAKTKIDEQNQIQQEINSRKQLYNSLDELNEKYKNHQITRTQLKQQTAQLVSQYDLEKSAVRDLTYNYDKLGQAIARQRLQDAQAASKSAQTEQENAATQVEKIGNGIGSKTTIGISSATQSDKKILNLVSGLKEVNIAAQQGAQAIGTTTFRTLELGKSAQDIVASYDALSTAIEKTGMTQEELDKSPIYKSICDWLAKMKDAVEAYKQATEDASNTEIYEKGFQAIANKQVNFDNVKNLSQYKQQRQKLIQSLGNEEGADTFLQEYFSELYNNFNEASILIDNLRKNLNSTSPQVEKLIGSLDESHFAALIKEIGLDGSIISSWQTLYNIIQDLSTIDLSNMNVLQGTDEIQSLKEAASDKYNIYQSLQQQVSGGKSISKSEYKNLQPEVQQFFSMMANGSYKMTGDAKQFYETVNSLKLDGFIQTIDAINGELEKVKNLQDLNYKNFDPSSGRQKQFNYQENNKSAITSVDSNTMGVNGLSEVSFNTDIVKNQLDYLEAVSASDKVLQDLVEDWKTAYQEESLNKSMIEDIARKYEEAGDQTDKLDEKQEKLTEQAEELKRQLREALDPIDDDIAEQSVNKLADRLQEASEKSDDFSKDLMNDREAAEQVAESLLRFDDAVQDVQKNFEDWSDVLNDTGDNMAAFSEIADDLADAYGDLLNIDSSTLSDGFLRNAENLNLMKQATEGNIDAYDELASKAAEDILIHIENDGNNELNGLADEYTTLKNYIENNNIQVGAEIDDAGVIAACQSIADQAFAMAGNVQEAVNMANAAYSAMGYDVQLDTVTEQATDPVQDTEITKKTTIHSFYESMPVYTTEKAADKQYARISGTHGASGQVASVDTVITPINSETTKNTTATGLKVAKVGKGATGAVKTKNATHKTKGKGGGGGKKGGGGGGGGGKSKKPASTPDSIGKKVSSATAAVDNASKKDPYYKINRELERTSKLLKEISRDADKAFGKKRTQELEKQVEQLENQNKQLKEKQAINKTELQNKRSQLEQSGFTFDSSGDISNYSGQIDAKETAINTAAKNYQTATNSYNEYSKTYNATVQEYNDLKKYQELSGKKKLSSAQKKKLKELKKTYGNLSSNAITKKLQKLQTKQKQQSAVLTAKQTAMNNAKTTYENQEKALDDVLDKIDAYTEEQDLSFDLEEQLRENEDNKYALKIEILNSGIQLQLDVKEAEKDWNDFKRKVINDDNIFKDSNFSKIVKDVKLEWDNLISYFQSSNNTEGDLITTITHLQNLQKQIDKMKNGGISQIYGTNLKQAVEDYNNYFDKLKEKYQNIQESITAIRESFIDTIDDIEESFEKQIDKYQDITDLIQYDLDLLNLLYGQKNYDAMNNYYNQLTNNQINQIDLLRKQSQFWLEKWNEALDSGNTQLAKQFEEKYRNTFSNLNSVIQDSIKTLQDKYINSINQIFDNLDKKITNQQGTDYIELDWELKNKNNENYLDTIEAAFAVENLENKFQDLLNNTKSIKNQQAIKKVMDEQLSNLKNKEKLTQYDIDRAEQLLQIEQARAALEDAQAAKTELRLRRDSQGNYSYEYTANTQATTQAQQNLLEAQNNLYKMDKQQYQNNLNDMLSIWKEFQSQYIDILNDTNLTEEEKRKRQQLLEKEYGEYINNLTAENFNIRNNLSESALTSFAEIYNTSLQDLGKLSNDQKQNLMADLITGWNGGIQTMIDQITGEGGFTELIKDSLGEIEEKTEEYQKAVQTTTALAGKDLNDLKNGVDDVAIAYEGLIENNDKFIQSMKDQVNSVYNLVNALQKLTEWMEKSGTSFADLQNTHKYITDFMNENIDSPQSNLDISELTNLLSNTFSVENISQITSAIIDQLSQSNKQQLELILKDMSLSEEEKQNKIAIATFASGGYTGQWINNNGRLALLHQKELVLNEVDTKNLLDTISILKTIDTSLNTNLINKVQDISNQLVKENSNSAIIEQQVHIEASFPNVNSKRQIEEAFNDLVNLAAQRAMRK